jgi:hypothetical protein
MKILTKISLLCIGSILVMAKSTFTQLTPALNTHNVAFDSQHAKVETLPSIGISLKSKKYCDYNFTLAYASEKFKNIKFSHAEQEMENIYFHIRYNF